ncbi:MAG: DUF5671 domain-containing protein [Pseudomonadota bacterium]
MTTLDLSEFVRGEIAVGRDKADIRTKLLSADWTETEVERALSKWQADADAGAVPRPLRSMAARDAIFYLTLFTALGVLIGTIIPIGFLLVEYWLPESYDRPNRVRMSDVRWLISTLIVFAPVFWVLDTFDAKGLRTDAMRKHLSVRRWLSGIALFAAAMTFMVDAIWVIHAYLDGQMTPRFLLKSGLVAALASYVFLYFLRDRFSPSSIIVRFVGKIIAVFAALLVTLALYVVGGPTIGQQEQRDRARLSDLGTLSWDVHNCRKLRGKPLPEDVNLLGCVANPARLTAFASEITYYRVSDQTFKLCVDLERPETARVGRGKLDGKTLCRSTDRK